MSIYRRDEISPEWEPPPWRMAPDAANAQERGFYLRALKPIQWQPVPWQNFPEEGLLGQQKDWFSSADVAFFASIDGEDLLLIRNTWFGWPDPPEWGLASRPDGQHHVAWQRWGHFANLPAAWNAPGAR